jgi:signal transduction histidine kinase
MEKPFRDWVRIQSHDLRKGLQMMSPTVVPTVVSPLSRLRAALDQSDGVREVHVTASAAPFFQTWLAALLVAGSYYVGTKAGFFFTPPQQAISTFWPPNAILLAALILAPPRMWLAFLFAVLPAHLIAQLQTEVPLETALGWFAGNVGEALIGAACIRYFRKGRPLFETVQGLIVFLLFGVVVAPVLTSFLDAAVVTLTGQGSEYWKLWVTRLSSNAIADLTLVPTIILAAGGVASWVREANLWRYIEAFLLGVGILFVSVLVFGSPASATNRIPVLICTLLPILLWAAVRFGPGALSGCMLVIALVSAWNATQGRGLFASSLMEENIWSLLIFLSMLTVPLLALAVALVERRSKEDLLRDTRKKLIRTQENVRHRIARYLHDDVAQQLTLLGVEIDQLRIDSDASVRARLGRLYDRVSGISVVTRDLSHELYPFELEYLGLAPALRKLCGRIAGSTGIAVTFSEENFKGQLDTNISLCLYCAAQEALQNIVKRGHARTVKTTLAVTSSRALLRIVDDGVVVDSKQQGHERPELGAMGEYVMVFGGTVKITAVASEGTTVEASLPLSES